MARTLRSTSPLDEATLGAETLPLGLDSIHSVLSGGPAVVARPVEVRGLVAIALRFFGPSMPRGRTPGAA
jgi:hypothetical protein